MARSSEAVWMKKRRKRWKKEKRCIDCGGANDRKKRKTCSTCAQRKSEEHWVRVQNKNPNGVWWS